MDGPSLLLGGGDGFCSSGKLHVIVSCSLGPLLCHSETGRDSPHTRSITSGLYVHDQEGASRRDVF
jgi:hypothetical protein